MEAKQYQVGPLTMTYVFEPTNIHNLSDMQAVLDAVEAALSGKAELLEALRDLVEAMSLDGDPAFAHLVLDARAAIAKAMGDKS